jgi:DNA topoisomerase IB
VLAEQAGFDFVEMSDHYHPWVEAQGHSAFTWNHDRVLAAAVRLVDLGFFRPGGEEYAEGNGTFGLAAIRKEPPA